MSVTEFTYIFLDYLKVHFIIIPESLQALFYLCLRTRHASTDKTFLFLPSKNHEWKIFLIPLLYILVTPEAGVFVDIIYCFVSNSTVIVPRHYGGLRTRHFCVNDLSVDTIQKASELSPKRD